MLVFVDGGKPEYPEKNPRSKDENQHQTQSSCARAPCRIQTQATLYWWEASALEDYFRHSIETALIETKFSAPRRTSSLKNYPKIKEQQPRLGTFFITHEDIKTLINILQRFFPQVT